MSECNERDMAAKWLKERGLVWYASQPSRTLLTFEEHMAMLAEYAAWRMAEAWQPIATAPPDENPLLLANAVEVAEGWCGEREDGIVHRYADGDEFKGATYWRPMPEPPKEAK